MARFNLILFGAMIVALSLVRAQDEASYNDYGEYAEYQDYGNDYQQDYQQEDSLYYDYAEREQQKK